MVVRDSTSTPPGSKPAQPQIDQTASVHSFSNIVGDVKVGANVLIAPGTSIRADKGGSFRIGAETKVQDGAVIHGLEQGRVVGADQEQYSVWIGNNTSITHMALIHGPAYVGDHCFIGFRSTVFNARVGDGCIVMMHALIQDVAIPPGRYVPSGAVITTQQQADRLPEVKQSDQKFVAQVMGVNDAQRSGHHDAKNVSRIAPIRQQLERTYHGDSVNQVSDSTSSRSSSHTSSLMQNTRLAPETVDYVRQLLSQGLKVGAEHADKRRFQTSSWYSCGSIQSNREGEVLNAIENWTSEYSDEYVRVYGIDPRAKRRVSEVIINRPDGSGPRTAPTQHISASAPSYNYSAPASSPKRSNYSPSGSSTLSSDVVEKVQHFINQGFKIGTEHADPRRFQTSSWQSCSPIQTQRPAEALAALESCLAEHKGEYVRFFGIDPRLKKRISEVIIQRPGDKNNGAAAETNGYGHQSNRAGHTANGSYSSNYSGGGNYSSSSNYGGSSYGGGGAVATKASRLSSEVVNQVRQLLSQGYRISAEHADPRRFQTSSWKTCAPIQSSRDTDVLAALENCMAENTGEYVRLVGVDTRTKRRVAETIVQRP